MPQARPPLGLRSAMSRAVLSQRFILLAGLMEIQKVAPSTCRQARPPCRALFMSLRDKNLRDPAVLAHLCKQVAEKIL